MKLGNSLLQKGLFLVLVPLIFQLAVLGGLIYLLAEAEEVANRAAHAAKIDENLNHLIKGMLENMPTWEWHSDDTPPPNIDIISNDLLGYLARLKDLIKDHPDKVAAVEEVEKGAHEALQLLEVQKQSTYDELSPEDKGRRKRFRKIKQRLTESLKKLLPFASEERRIIRESPTLQAQNRERVRLLLTVAVIFNIVLAFTLVIFYNRDIVRRLSKIFDNSVRLASRQPLSPPSEGTDEIARLDQIFHTMAESIAESSRKESLVIENAQDVICSLDSKGSFITVNPAAQPLLGYTPEDLIGSRISNIILEADQEGAQTNLKLLMNGESLPPFEIRVVKKGGKGVDMLLSAHWSAQESSMFCVMHDVTGRKQAERLRQEVVQMVSHDLRTPLTTIRGILEIVASGKVGDLTEKGKNMIQMAEHSSMLMLALARDLLEIEKVEAGMLELNKNQLPVSDIFKQSVDAVNIIAQQRKVSIEAETTDAKVFADRDRMVQILVNLITNAVKFSPPNSKISLSACSTADSVEISVADQGRGIPPDLISSIFERFKQVRESDSKTDGGSGLGLAICKGLVELHGGNISVTSEEGKGSVFSFRIPNKKADEIALTQV